MTIGPEKCLVAKRLALVGCGRIAVAHALAALKLGANRCQVVAFCDSNRQRAVDFGAKFAPEALVFTEIAPLLEQTKPDALIICTPPATHAVLSTAALERGIAVLCEKPLATEVGMARKLMETANRNSAILRTSAKYRFCQGVWEAKTCLQNGVLGQLERVDIAFGDAISLENPWLCDAAQSGGGVLMDNGPHAVDLARFLLGEVHVTRAKRRFGREFRVEEEASLELRSPGGCPVFVELSWRQQLGAAFLKISGERGLLEARWDATVLRPNGFCEQILAPGYDKNRAFARQLEAFLEEFSPKNRINPTCWQIEDGLRAVELIAAAYEADKKRNGAQRHPPLS